MRITTKPRDGDANDAMLTELTHVLEQIARPIPDPAPPTEGPKRKPGAPSKGLARAADQGRPSFAHRMRLWSLICVVAVVCVAVVIAASPLSNGHSITPTLSVDAATTSPGVQNSSLQVQTAPRDPGPEAAPMSAELTEWRQTIARELAKLEQGLDDLKGSQAQLARAHAELAGHLDDMQDQMARHDTEVADSLKAAQDEVARRNLSTAAQLEAIQDQITRIGEQLKSRQKEADRLGAPKQLRHSPTAASPSSARPNASAGPKSSPQPALSPISSIFSLPSQ